MKNDKQADILNKEGLYEIASRVRGCRKRGRCGYDLFCEECAKNKALVATVALERIYRGVTFDKTDQKIQKTLKPVQELISTQLIEVKTLLLGRYQDKGDPYWGKTSQRKREILSKLVEIKNLSRYYDKVEHVGIGQNIRSSFETVSNAIRKYPARLNKHHLQEIISIFESIEDYTLYPFSMGWNLMVFKISDTGIPRTNLTRLKDGLKKFHWALRGPTTGMVAYTDIEPNAAFNHAHAWYRGPLLNEETMKDLWISAANDEEASIWFKEKTEDNEIGRWSFYSINSFGKEYPISEEYRLEVYKGSRSKQRISWYGCLNKRIKAGLQRQNSSYNKSH